MAQGLRWRWERVDGDPGDYDEGTPEWALRRWMAQWHYVTLHVRPFVNDDDEFWEDAPSRYEWEVYDGRGILAEGIEGSLARAKGKAERFMANRAERAASQSQRMAGDLDCIRELTREFLKATGNTHRAVPSAVPGAIREWGVTGELRDAVRRFQKARLELRECEQALWRAGRGVMRYATLHVGPRRGRSR